MGKKIIILGLAALMLPMGGFVFAQTIITLDQAISHGVNENEIRLEQGTKVMVLDFNSPSQNLSNYVLDEMIAGFVRNEKLGMVDNEDLEFVLKELNYHRSGNINNETARSIGRMLGAQYVISGALEESNSNYIIEFRTIAVEPGALQNITRVDVLKDAEILDLMAVDISAQAQTDISAQEQADISAQEQADASAQEQADAYTQAQTDDSDLKSRIVLSVGSGVYGRAEILHFNQYTGNFYFNNIKTDTQWIFGAPIPVFLNAEIFSYLLLDVSPYYLHIIDSGIGSNAIGAAFSIFGRIPIQLVDRVTLFPLLGVGYEMLFYMWEKDKNTGRNDFSRDFDSLNLKLGAGMNYNLTGNLRLNARFVWDILLYNKNAAERKKSIKNAGYSYLELQHAPSLFLGVNYVVLNF